METVDKILMYAQTIPTSVWQTASTIAVVLGAAILIAIATQLHKRLRKIDSKKAIMGLSLFYSWVGTAATYLLISMPVAPYPGLVELWAVLIGAATVVHRFMISPAGKRIEVWLQGFLEKVSAEQARREAAKTPVAQSLEQ